MRRNTVNSNANVAGDDRFPDYYTPDRCNFFVRLTDFQELPADWALDHLVLANNPDPQQMPGTAKPDNPAVCVRAI